MSAIVVPLLTDKVDAWIAWINECTGTRRTEFEEFNRRMGLTEHRVWLDEGPGGARTIVVHEGPGAETLMSTLATSDHPFDTWFRNNITEFHGMDFSQPMPGTTPRNMLNWTAGDSAREATT